MKSHQGESKSKSQIVLILGLALAIVGYFGPWVDHKTAALVLTGQDTGEFVKFLPEVRAGAVPMIREFFYIPPFAAALCLILLMANKRLAYPLVARAVMLLAVLGLAWAMLPPVWTPQLLVTAEFRKQTVAIAFCLLLLIVHPMLRYLPSRRCPEPVACPEHSRREGLTAVALRHAQDIAMMVLAFLGAVFPLWQFFAIREAVNRAYGWPVQVGWGLWGTVLGFLIVVAGAVSARRGPNDREVW
ncbi:MAG: hypothetical protein E3J21_18350 [Anaerolineales bacterium]|nr:MAG: hypothetical protein E3J21_18350 [Anaerolineales bacterium]